MKTTKITYECSNGNQVTLTNNNDTFGFIVNEINVGIGNNVKCNGLWDEEILLMDEDWNNFLYLKFSTHEFLQMLRNIKDFIKTNDSWFNPSLLGIRQEFADVFGIKIKGGLKEVK